MNLSVDPSAIMKLNIDPSKLQRRMPGDEAIARMREAELGLYKRAVAPPDETYAQVKVGGKVVASVMNSGGIVSSNAMGGQIAKLVREDSDALGPALARERAERLAKALGGTVEKASTAQTQAEWNARPPVTWSIDYEAMEADGHAVPQNERRSTPMTSRLASETIASLLNYSEV